MDRLRQALVTWQRFSHVYFTAALLIALSSGTLLAGCGGASGPVLAGGASGKKIAALTMAAFRHRKLISDASEKGIQKISCSISGVATGYRCLITTSAGELTCDVSGSADGNYRDRGTRSITAITCDTTKHYLASVEHTRALISAAVTAINGRFSAAGLTVSLDTNVCLAGRYAPGGKLSESAAFWISYPATTEGVLVAPGGTFTNMPSLTTTDIALFAGCAIQNNQLLLGGNENWGVTDAKLDKVAQPSSNGGVTSGATPTAGNETPGARATCVAAWNRRPPVAVGGTATVIAGDSPPATCRVVIVQPSLGFFDCTYGQSDGFRGCPSHASTMAYLPKSLPGANAAVRSDGRLMLTSTAARATPTSRSGAWHTLKPFPSGSPFANTPGTESVNTDDPRLDWAFLAAGAYSAWEHHQFSTTAYAADGLTTNKKLYDFTCVLHTSFVECTNGYGDAMRYTPSVASPGSEPSAGSRAASFPNAPGSALSSGSRVQPLPAQTEWNTTRCITAWDGATGASARSTIGTVALGSEQGGNAPPSALIEWSPGFCQLLVYDSVSDRTLSFSFFPGSDKTYNEGDGYPGRVTFRSILGAQSLTVNQDGTLSRTGSSGATSSAASPPSTSSSAVASGPGESPSGVYPIPLDVRNQFQASEATQAEHAGYALLDCKTMRANQFDCVLVSPVGQPVGGEGLQRISSCLYEWKVFNARGAALKTRRYNLCTESVYQAFP